MSFSRWTILFVLIAAVSARADSPSALTVTPAADHHGVNITVEPTSRGWGLIEVIDPATGACRQTVYAGTFAPGQEFSIVPSELLPPGSYRLRLREGVTLALAGEIKRPVPSDSKWVNPTALALAGPWIYVLDSSLQLSSTAKPAEVANEAPFLYKFDHDGKPDPAFADHGRLTLPAAYYNLRCVVAEPDGKFYMPTGGHEAVAYNGKGAGAGQTIGGWDNNPQGTKCTVWVSSLALGWKNHIYIPNGGYGNGRVYDRTKNAFDGIVCSYPLPDYEGLPNYVCADFNGSVYMTGRSQQITKYVDDGKTMTRSYQSDPAAKLARPTGGSASAGLIWEACFGPGFGPYWDSGGGGEVVLFWDDGHQLRLIDRFGTPGAPGIAANGLEFMNPSTAIMTPDHTELWVAEGGGANAEGPPGNARVRRFVLKAEHTEEVVIELGK